MNKQEYINSLNKLNNNIEKSIELVNREYQSYYFTAGQNILTQKYNIKSLDDNSFINNKIPDKYNLIKDNNIYSLLNSLSSIFNIFDDSNWLRFTEDNLISSIKDYKCMYANSISENNTYSKDFTNFINILDKYKDKFNLEVDKLFYDKNNKNDDDDDNYEINISWIVVYIK